MIFIAIYFENKDGERFKVTGSSGGITDIPVATENVLGGIKSSQLSGKVSVDNTGITSVNDVVTAPGTGNLQFPQSFGNGPWTLEFSEDDSVPPKNGIPAGGEIGQILVKQSSQDYDVSWKNQRICVNPNLLVNPYFLRPINQRGETSWSTGHTIDRWRVIGNAEIGENGVRIINPEGDESIFLQIMDSINLADGMPRTVSYLDSNGDLYYGPLTDSYTTYGNFKFTYATGEGFYIRTLDSSISIQCVKLEVGTEQTLAQYVNGKWVLNDIPDYSVELLKCQRYYLPGFMTASCLTIDYSILYIPIRMASLPNLIGNYEVYLQDTNTLVSGATVSVYNMGTTHILFSINGTNGRKAYINILPGAGLSCEL